MEPIYTRLYSDNYIRSSFVSDVLVLHPTRFGLRSKRRSSSPSRGASDGPGGPSFVRQHDEDMRLFFRNFLVPIFKIKDFLFPRQFTYFPPPATTAVPWTVADHCGIPTRRGTGVYVPAADEPAVPFRNRDSMIETQDS